MVYERRQQHFKQNKLLSKQVKCKKLLMKIKSIQQHICLSFEKNHTLRNTMFQVSLLFMKVNSNMHSNTRLFGILKGVLADFCLKSK